MCLRRMRKAGHHSMLRRQPSRFMHNLGLDTLDPCAESESEKFQRMEGGGGERLTRTGRQTHELCLKLSVAVLTISQPSLTNADAVLLSHEVCTAMIRTHKCGLDRTREQSSRPN
jgi:hypothetical protein